MQNVFLTKTSGKSKRSFFTYSRAGFGRNTWLLLKVKFEKQITERALPINVAWWLFGHRLSLCRVWVTRKVTLFAFWASCFIVILRMINVMTYLGKCWGLYITTVPSYQQHNETNIWIDFFLSNSKLQFSIFVSLSFCNSLGY